MAQQNQAQKNNEPRMSVAVNDDKYTFFLKESDWRIHVLRYGEPWLVFDRGTNAIFSLMAELEEAREKLSALAKVRGTMTEKGNKQ